jgi:mannosyltransferase OCH1-like enzyme
MPRPLKIFRTNYISRTKKNMKIMNSDNNKFLNEEIIIPANIFQTWHTKVLPPLMLNAILLIKQSNPNFQHYLFDINDCRNFIKQHFDSKVLKAYDKLVPLAYKADLWRYCVLYINGGIYLDVKYVPINGFKLANLLSKEHFVLDLDKNGIYNALMVTKPGNKLLLNAINNIVENVEKNFYGSNYLEPTGPKLLWKIIKNDSSENSVFENTFDIKHVLDPKLHSNEDKSRLITFYDKPILKCYQGYFKERKISERIIPHYGDLWRQRNVYHL